MGEKEHEREKERETGRWRRETEEKRELTAHRARKSTRHLEMNTSDRREDTVSQLFSQAFLWVQHCCGEE